MKCQISAQVLYYVISQYNKKSFIYCILAYTFYSRKKRGIHSCIPRFG